MSDTTETTATETTEDGHAAHDGHGHATGDGHGHGDHGEIHMPPNSWAPISMAFALCCTFVGFVTAPLGPVLWIIGLLWVVGSGVAWFRGARNEFHELPD